MTLRLRTFGAVCLERDGLPLTGAPAQKRRLALLAYLAAAGDTLVTRDKLMGLLWPERTDASARHSLSQLLYALRQELPDQALITSGDAVRLDARVLPSDIRGFVDGIRSGQDEFAVEWYRGPFLDGFYIDDAEELERWIEAERGNLAALYADALDRLARAAVAAGEPFRAVEWLRRRVALVPTDAPAAIRLIDALLSLGDRTGAQREARRYGTATRADGDAPDPAVAEAAQRSLPAAGTPAPPATPVSEPIAATASAYPAHSPARPFRRAIGRWATGTAAALVVALAVVLISQSRGDALRADGTRAVTVLLGELEGGDAELALAVREALRAELSQADGITQLSDLRVRELQSLAGTTPGRAPPTSALLDVAVRGGAQIIVTGSAAPLGAGAQLVVQLIEPSSGEVVATLSERVLRTDDVLPAVASIGRSLRAAILHVPVDTTVRPLPAVKTASLPALKSYALARQRLAIGHRDVAIELAERALLHDSAFALAHYLAGDALWFIDRQSHAEAHLSRAQALAGALPYRERLVVRARFEQLVMDRADSALVYWDMLRDAAPRDPLAYEGRAWTLRALGRYEEAAASADRSLDLDPSVMLPNSSNAVFSYLSVGDTARALAFAQRRKWSAGVLEAQFHAAVSRGDLGTAERLARTQAQATRMPRLHEISLLSGDLAGARGQLDSLRAESSMAHLPRALIVQGLMELHLAGDRAAAGRYAREALQWLREQDLSPPALARIAERVGALGAAAGDREVVAATLDLVRQRDRRRRLHSHLLAERGLLAAQAYARGDMASAARLAEEARHGVYFSRSLNTLVRLEADARHALGDSIRARELDAMIERHEIADGDWQTWAILRAVTRRR